MVIQQDNTRELPSRSIPSSIKSRRRLHLNTRAPNVSHHSYRSHPYFCRQQIHSRKQNRQAHENAPYAFIGQPRKNRQNLDKHCLFVAVSRKTSPYIAHNAAPTSVGIAARSPTINSQKHIGQCKHAPFILPRSILRRFTQRAPLSAISRRFGHICPIKRDTRQQLSLLAQRRATAHALRICLYYPLATTRRAFKAHICNSLAPPMHCFML